MSKKRMDGKLFTQDMIHRVWEKADTVLGVDPNIFRKDKCGAWIKKDLYGKSDTGSTMAWEIDHIKPYSWGGTDELSNLQALQYNNNEQKNDQYPFWSCTVKSVEHTNQFINS